jgi:hypothetical protein
VPAAAAICPLFPCTTTARAARNLRRAQTHAGAGTLQAMSGWPKPIEFLAARQFFAARQKSGAPARVDGACSKRSR